MITADTITDEQIRELRAAVFTDPKSDSVDRQEMDLLEYRATLPCATEAAPYRARCASLLNKRRA